MIAWIGNQFDTTIFAFAGHAIAQVMKFMSPIAIAWLTVWVLMYGYSVLFGKASEPLLDFASKMALNILIVAAATSAAIYHEWIVDTASSLMLNGAKNFAPPGSPVASAVNVWDAIEKFNDKASSLTIDMLNQNVFTAQFWVSLLAVLFFSVGNAILIAAAMLVALISKGFLAFLFGIGPLFILFLLFQTTRQWFMNWLSSTLGMVILSWMVFFLLGFSLTLSIKVVEAITSNLGAVNVLTQSLIYLPMCLVFAVMLWQAPSFVVGLTGGAGGQMGVQMISTILLALRGRKSPPPPNQDGGSGSSGGGMARSHGFGYRAGNAVGNLTGVQWAFARTARSASSSARSSARSRS